MNFANNMESPLTIHPPRKVAAGRGWAWIREGFGYFMKAPLMWLGVIVVLFVISMLLNLIPLVGPLANALLPPVWSAGVLLGCHALHRNEQLKFEHLFAGFGPSLKPLLISGVIVMAMQVVVVLVLFGSLAFELRGEDAAAAQELAANPLSLLLRFVLLIVFMVPISAATLFAPALIMLSGQPVVEALRLSMKACFLNVGAVLVWGAIAIVLGMISAMLAGLGFLVLIPVLVVSGYLAYRDFFID
jgi:Predicted integral membrane protein